MGKKLNQEKLEDIKYVFRKNFVKNIANADKINTNEYKNKK